MKLYIADFAPNPRRVRWILAEKRISDIEVIKVDLMSLEHKRIDPITAGGSVTLPVLELDDGTCIAESIAIGRYLENLYPEPNLYGRDAKETAIIEMWTRRVEMLMANPAMMAVRMTLPALAVLEAPNAEVGAYNLKVAEAFADALDAHMAGRDFIATDRMTVVDIAAATSLDFARVIRFRPDRGRENLRRWLLAMRERAPKEV